MRKAPCGGFLLTPCRLSAGFVRRQRGESALKLAIADQNSPSIHLFDGRLSTSLGVVDIHAAPVRMCLIFTPAATVSRWRLCRSHTGVAECAASPAERSRLVGDWLTCAEPPAGLPDAL